MISASRCAAIAELTRRYEALQREIGRTTAAIAEDEGRLDSARSAMQRLGSTVIAAGEAQRKLRADIDAATDAQERQAAAVQRAAAAADLAQRTQAFFAPRVPAAENGAGFEALAAEEMRLDQAAASLRASLNPIVGIQDRFNAKLREANALFAAGKISAAELTQQTGRLTAEMKRASDGASQRGRFSALGLEPYQLTNLGYQLNDIGTQLASGTSLAQTLAQQAGQIIQIFPRVGGAIAGAFTNPAFLGAAAVVGTIAAAVVRLSNEAQRLRDFDGILTANGNGFQYQAKALSDLTERTRHLGIAASDSEAALRTFVNSGIAPDRLEMFVRTSRDVAAIMSSDIPDAAKLLADGFDGGFGASAH